VYRSWPQDFGVLLDLAVEYCNELAGIVDDARKSGVSPLDHQGRGTAKMVSLLLLGENE